MKEAMSSMLNPVKRMDEPFPLKLHRLLRDVENTAQAEILAWDPDGRSFTIYQPKEFAELIMGEYFRQTKYKSFQRQMNLYGFSREVRGKIRGVYSHPLFVRHDRDLCLQIKRSNRVPARSFGSPAGSASIAASLAGDNNNAAAAASIDVSSPLFAPLKHQMSETIATNQSNNFINLGLAFSDTKIHPTSFNNINSFSILPSFALPAGGLPIHNKQKYLFSKEISLADDDDEESMGTIDELPADFSSYPQQQPQQQPHQLQNFSLMLFGEKQLPEEDDFTPVAV